MEPPDSNRPRILVVDDDRLVRLSLVEHLGRVGFEVASCDSGECGLEWIEAWNPALVLLDVDLPGIDGLATLARARLLRPRLPVILMSGRQLLRDEVLGLGAADFLGKPFCFNALDSAIQRALAA